MAKPNEKEPIEEEQEKGDDIKFPDAEEIKSLLGDEFEMPEITTASPDSAPSAEPEEGGEGDGEVFRWDEGDESARRENDERGSLEKDAKGRVFDPQLHSTDDNGNPRYNKKGLFIFLRKDKRGRVDTTEHTKAENFESALLYFDAFTDSASALMGEHWKPNNEDQRKAVAKSIARWLDTTEMEPLGPLEAMLLKVGTYSAPRVAHRDTFTNLRVKIVSTWWGVKDFWATLTGKKRKSEKPEPRPVAQEINSDGINIDPNSL